MEIKCEYCGSMIPENVEQCPYCGASNNSIKRTADGTPKTIAELAKWYEDRHLPPYETTRFFIGIDYRQPRAFGIYQAGNEFIVYKNKADGTRAVRYQGTDEAYAVNELYLKLKDEILNQKAHQQKHTNENFAQETKKVFSDTFSSKNVNEYIIKPSIAMVIGIVMFIALIIVGFALNDTYKGIGWDLLISSIAGIVGAFFLTDFIENHKRFKPFGLYAAWLKKPKCSAMRHAMHYFITVVLIALVLITPIHNYCKTDYFKYNDTVYVNSHYSWFEYDDDSYDYNEISRSDVPQEVLDNKSLYGFDYSDLVWDSSIIKFENSGYYEDHYESSGSSSSDYDSDYDWDSGDSWDSGGSDWDSDW